MPLLPMTQRLSISSVATFAAAAVLSLSGTLAHAQLLAPAQPIYGLTSGAIVRFDDRAPRRTTEVVQRLFGSQALVAIDFSPRDGQLYALDNAGGLYRMTLEGGQQIPVGRIEGALIGSFFGMDFEPDGGSLRIVSDTGSHLSHDLTSQRTRVLPLLTDGGAGGAILRGAAGIAYSNIDRDPATAATLYLIDHERDRLARVDAATGTVTAIAGIAPARRFARPVSFAALVGFDIATPLDEAGRALDNIAYLSLQPDDFTSPHVVYRLDLGTGRVTSLGSIDARPSGDLIDIAIRP